MNGSIEGFSWCGGCGAPTRPLTGAEARSLLVEAADAVARSEDPLEVLREIGWLAEMHYRGKYRCCTCPPPTPPPWWATAPTEGFHLYRLWSETRRLLYVGVSRRLRNRLKRHAKRWGDLIAYATWEEHEDETSMLTAEGKAVATEHPAFNKALV